MGSGGFTSAYDQAVRKINSMPSGQTFHIDNAGISGLHFHQSLRPGAFNELPGHTDANSQQVGNWHLWPGLLAAFFGLTDHIQAYNDNKIADYAFSKGHPVALDTYSNGVNAGGELARHVMNENQQLQSATVVEPATSDIQTLVDINNASVNTWFILSGNDPAVNLELFHVSATDIQNTLGQSATVTDPQSGTHKEDVNLQNAMKKDAPPGSQ